MRARIETLTLGLAASLRRRHRTDRRYGPRRARGTFVPLARDEASLRPAF